MKAYFAKSSNVANGGSENPVPLICIGSWELGMLGLRGGLNAIRGGTARHARPA